MLKINFIISSRYAVDRKKLRQKAIEILKEHKLDNAQLDVWVVGKRKIKELNEKHLKHEGTTDVLSFPQHEKEHLDDFSLPSDEPLHLGEIVISFPESVVMAKRYGKMVDDQLSFYLEHGLMHLLGYHHE